jgi:NDP-sugar pyrophosphorylase family protein
MSIDALILAGGLGTRLREKVSNRPKVMALINDRPFLDYLFDQLSNTGIQNVILSTGYMSDFIQSYYGDSYKNLNLLYSEEPKRLGTGGAIKFSAEKSTRDLLLVMNGDSYCDVDLNEFINSHVQSVHPISVVINYQENVSRYGSIDVKEDRIAVFNEKSGKNEPGWINAGIYIIPKKLMSSIREGKISLETELFPNWIPEGMHAYKSNDKFIDIGTPQSYEDAQHFFTKQETTR